MADSLTDVYILYVCGADDTVQRVSGQGPELVARVVTSVPSWQCSSGDDSYWVVCYRLAGEYFQAFMELDDFLSRDAWGNSTESQSLKTFFILRYFKPVCERDRKDTETYKWDDIVKNAK